VSDPFSTAWEAQRAAIGAYIRSQRELARLSLRELAKLTQISNAYLSQLERGLHDPSLRVLVLIAEALNIPVEDLLQRAQGGATGASGAAGGWDTAGGGEGASGGDSGPAPDTAATAPPTTEEAIRGDPKLSAAEKEALLSVYRSYLRERDQD
jgi:transcriptional regulator with XRE-family HTH domain